MKTKISNTDKTGITDNEILQTKPSFNSVYSKFISTPAKVLVSKSMFYWASSVVVVATTTTLIIVNVNKGVDLNKTALDPVDTLKTKAYVETPIQSVAVEYKEYKLDAGKATEISTCRGTRISIPEDAFVYDDGTPVEGEVTLKYREFNNPVEIFRSGIPMQYDSANTDYVFESAGMIELIAQKGEKNVALAKNKAIDVALKSDNSEDRFNVYYLDTAKRNWVYQGRDIYSPDAKPVDNTTGTKSTDTKENNTTIITEETTTDNYQNNTYMIKYEAESDTSDDVTEIIKPVQASKNAILFKVDYDTKDFPELSAYTNMLFEITDNTITFNKEWYTVNWDKILLKHTASKDIYQVTLQKRDSVVSFKARPVFDKTQYESALKIYAENQKAQQRTDTRQLTSKISATTLTNSYASGLGNGSTVTRSFKVVNMGVWNCDHPVPFSNFNTIAGVTFKDIKSGSLINCKTIYTATLSANILMQWNAMRIGYNKIHDNICFAVTYDEKIAIINPVDFKNTVSAGKSDFTANVYEPVEGIKELNKWIDAGI
jgi:hypothetical protein